MNGSPPGARATVDALPSLRISEEMIGSGITDCAICKESLFVGVLSKELPCKHVYLGSVFCRRWRCIIRVGFVGLSCLRIGGGKGWRGPAGAKGEF